MTPDFVALVFAALSFVVTFLVARRLGRGFRERRRQREQERKLAGESRQARRARERRERKG